MSSSENLAPDSKKNTQSKWKEALKHAQPGLVHPFKLLQLVGTVSMLYGFFDAVGLSGTIRWDENKNDNKTIALLLGNATRMEYAVPDYLISVIRHNDFAYQSIKPFPLKLNNDSQLIDIRVRGGEKPLDISAVAEVGPLHLPVAGIVLGPYQGAVEFVSGQQEGAPTSQLDLKFSVGRRIEDLAQAVGSFSDQKAQEIASAGEDILFKHLPFQEK